MTNIRHFIDLVEGRDATAPTKFVVAWGERRSQPLGRVVIEAATAQEARRIFKRDYIDARVFGWGVVQICYVFEKASDITESFDDAYDEREPAHREQAVARVMQMVSAFAKRHGVRAEFQPFGHSGEFELTDLYADEPGQGAGTKVMTLLANLCDRYDLTVYCKPESPRNLGFYARFGFESSERHFNMLVRFPPFDIEDV